MSAPSTKPYLIRAIYEWCTDNGLTPYLAVAVDERVRVPREYVRNGEIVLNIRPEATRHLVIGNDLIQFSARFNGVAQEVSVPIGSVTGIFARENGEGLFFPAEPAPSPEEGGEGGGDGSGGPGEPQPPRGKPKLTVVK